MARNVFGWFISFVWPVLLVLLLTLEKPNKPNEPNKLSGMQLVELVDESLELGRCVAALVGGDLLIDGDGHGCDGGAHLVNSVLIGRRACLVGIHDQHGT